MNNIKVIISEKPSVAREFAKALDLNVKSKDGYLESDEYIVTWCVGHLVTMSYPEKYDEKLKFWNFNTLPFIPKEYKYEIIEGVKKQFEIVNSILSKEDVETIYVCTDSGREGEYIYRLVDSLCNVKCKNKKRVWIDSQTKEEIIKGINEAKNLEEYDSLADSAYLRAIEDYLIGINFSRIMSLKHAKSVAKKLEEERVVISIGRVMTCVLGMIVERERAIRDFISLKYYKLISSFDEGFLAEWKAIENTKYFDQPTVYNNSGFLKENEAKELANYLKDGEAIITEFSKKSVKENPPLLFNLAELQNECTKKYKISPDETLSIVQSLYEKKLVTYPRTDARVLSTAVAKNIKVNLNGIFKNNKDEEIKKVITEIVDNKYNTDLTKSKYVNDDKITDHYAIIPTGYYASNLDDLSTSIFNLITKRFLQIFYPQAVYNKINITVDIKDEKFFASAKVLITEGYLKVFKNKDDKENKEDVANNFEKLKTLKKGAILNLKDIDIKEAETSSLTRYSSGSIILAMENAGKLIEDESLREQIKSSGIGTSATRAEIIKKLIKIGYIASNNKTQILTPTIKGEAIYDVVKFSMSDLLNPELTASWEKGLNMVYKKEITKKDFEEKLYSYITKKIDKLKGGRYF